MFAEFPHKPQRTETHSLLLLLTHRVHPVLPIEIIENDIAEVLHDWCVRVIAVSDVIVVAAADAVVLAGDGAAAVLGALGWKKIVILSS